MSGPNQNNRTVQQNSNYVDIGDAECREDYVEIVGGRGVTDEIPYTRDR